MLSQEQIVTKSSQEEVQFLKEELQAFEHLCPKYSFVSTNYFLFHQLMA